MGHRYLHAALLVAVLLLAGCSAPSDKPAVTEPAPSGGTPSPTSASASVAPPSKPSAGVGLPTPDEGLPSVSSVDGLLQVKLVMKNATVSLNGRPYVSTLYNGQLISPVWRLQRGDVLQVELHDEAFVTNDPANYTNLHFHGLNVPPSAPGDNVFVQVYPNGTALPSASAHAGHGAHGVPDLTAVGVYRYALIIPEDHPAGLFWWHAHPHGVSDPQVRGGLSGAMVIGDLAEEQYPEIDHVEERILLFRDLNNPASAKPSIAGGKPLRTLNGSQWSTFGIAPGETQFWRMANVGADLDFNVSLVSNATNESVPFYVIAVDGNVLEAPRMRTSLFLHPGARMEAFVVGPAAGGYTLRHLPVLKQVKSNLVETQADLALVVSGGVPSGPSSTAAQIMASAAADVDERFLELRAWIADGNRTVPRTVAFTVDDSGPTLGINGRPYDVTRDDVNVTYGDVEVWTLRNPTNASHVFHIHQLDYLVLEVNGTAAMSGGLQDTVLVPPWGSVKIAIPFTTPNTIGRYVFHCHYLVHEDAGMMANVRVDYAGRFASPPA